MNTFTLVKTIHIRLNITMLWSNGINIIGLCHLDTKIGDCMSDFTQKEPKSEKNKASFNYQKL